MWSDAAIFVNRTHRDGTVCQTDHMVDVRASVISMSIADLVLLSLMLFGLLRWKHALLTGGGIWRVMYVQVGICCAVVAMLIIQIHSGHRD
jgi:hypothetical protein